MAEQVCRHPGCLSRTISCTPTFCRLDLAGVKDPLADERDGVSFAPVLRGEKNALEDPERHRVAILVEKPVSSSSGCWRLVFETVVWHTRRYR